MKPRWHAMLGLVMGLAILSPPGAWAQSALPWVFHSGATGTANGNAMTADYFSTVAVQIEGTFVGTVVFEKKSLNGTGYFLVQCRNSASGETSTEASEPGYWECPGAANSFRARVSAYTSGTIVVTGNGTTAVASIRGGGGSGWPSGTSDKEINDADGLANYIWILGSGGDGVGFGYDPTDGPQIVAKCGGVVNDCHYVRALNSGKYFALNDASGNPVFRILPSGSTPKAQYTFHAGHYPLKSFYLSARALEGDGTNCPSRPTVVTISNMPMPTYVCTENNSSRLRAMVTMRNDWDGGAIYLKPYYAQTANDTGSVLLDAAAACRAVGVAFNGTYGTEVNIDDAALVGNGAIESTLSGAMTPNGTCNPGDALFFYLDVDATSNPTTAAATLNFLGVDVFYSSTSLSH